MLRYDYNKGYVMNYNKFFINGKWVEPNSKDTLPVINPANEEVICDISLGNKFDLDNAVNSARKAFISYSKSPKEDRISILDRIIASHKKRMDEL